MIKTKQKHIQAGGYIIDIICLLLLICFSLIDSYLFKIKIEEYDNIFYDLSAIALTLLPAVITIVSISISLSKEKIYGATIREINSIRGFWHFNFLHMALVMCTTFFAYGIFKALNLKISIYFLELISFFYSVYFLIQEIPLLTHSPFTIKQILRKRYLTSQSNNKLFNEKEKETFETMVTNIIFSEGIPTAFETFKNKGNDNSNVLDYLFDFQNQYLWDVQDNFSISKSSIGNSYKDISIIQAIEKGYDNIEFYLTNKCEYFPSSKYYQITRSLFSLHKLCDSYDLKTKEQKRIESLISPYFLKFEPIVSNDLSTSTLVCMSATTLNSGEIWFLELLRDNNWGFSSIFSFDSCSLGIFVSMIICHLFKNNVLTKKERESIDEFLNENYKGINANGSNWLINISRAIEFSKTSKIINSLSNLITYYKSVSDGTFFLHGNRKMISYDVSEEFTLNDLINYWLEICLYSLTFDSYNDEFPRLINKLDDDSKKAIAEVLSDKWLDNGKIRYDIDFTFLKTFLPSEDFKLTDNYSNHSFIKHLIEFHDSFYKDDFNKNKKNYNYSHNLKDEIIESFENAVANNNFFNRSIDVKDEKYLCFQWVFNFENNENVLRVYLDKLPDTFNYNIYKEICKNANTRLLDSLIITDDVAEEIIKFKPQFTSSLYKINCYLNDKSSKFKNEIKELNLEEINSVSNNLYWKKDGIKFNAEISKGNTFARKLNDKELDYFIESNYKPSDNGLYRYSKHDNETKHSFCVTKDELKEILANQVLFVTIVFKQKIVIEKDSVLFFKKQDKSNV